MFSVDECGFDDFGTDSEYGDIFGDYKRNLSVSYRGAAFPHFGPGSRYSLAP